jgi:hypothetical protein
MDGFSTAIVLLISPLQRRIGAVDDTSNDCDRADAKVLAFHEVSDEALEASAARPHYSLHSIHPDATCCVADV